MTETQFGNLVLGLLVILIFGHRWSRDTLRHKEGFKFLNEKPDRKIVIMVINLAGLMAGILLLALSTLQPSVEPISVAESKVASHILFLDISVVKNVSDPETCKLLNSFLEKTKAKVVVISNERFNRHTLINHDIELIRAICTNRGIKGNIIGSIPYTKGEYTRHQEIKLWVRATKIKFDNCVIIDKGPCNVDKITRTVVVDGVLKSWDLLSAINILETEYNPNIFSMRMQNYDDYLKARKQ